MRLHPERTIINKRVSSARRFDSYVGAAHIAVIALLALSLFSAGLYVYTVNRSAVQGYAIRTLEKDLKELKKANAELRVREAEEKSLSRVEEGSNELRMEKVDISHIVNIRTNEVASR